MFEAEVKEKVAAIIPRVEAWRKHFHQYGAFREGSGDFEVHSGRAHEAGHSF